MFWSDPGGLVGYGSGFSNEVGSEYGSIIMTIRYVERKVKGQICNG